MCRIVFIVVAFLTIGALTANAAEVLVLASDAPGIKAGNILKSPIALSVPDGSRVTLIVDSGMVVTVRGPHSGPLEFTGEERDPSLLSSLAALLTPAGTDTSTIGMTREDGRPVPDDPWMIDTSQSGDLCVPSTGPVILWRADVGRTVTLSLKNLSDKSSYSGNWPAGAATVDWPPPVTLAEGVKYRAQVTGAAKILILHVVPGNLRSAAHGVAWMAERGCVVQARRLLAGMD